MPVPHAQSPLPAPRTVAIRDRVAFGPGRFVIMAGPCAVESRSQVLAAARAVADSGAAMLRGGAFKPRTSPRSFQGLGEAGLRLLAEASGITGLPVVTEVMDPRDVELVAEHAAMLQVGSRNMQNFSLLREVGRARLPVLLKRGAAATLDELIAAADYVLDEGNPNVVLCERGVRSFDPTTRYLLDLAAVAELAFRTPLPVVVDPSHATGRRHLVAPMAKAAVMAGAAGLLVDVHPDPASALCDGPQALLPAEFAVLVEDLRTCLPAVGRTLLRSAATEGTAIAGHGKVSVT
jgi:3-deoxy-7-phosphoheptulonate synthase